jgi:hypothetical protein
LNEIEYWEIFYADLSQLNEKNSQFKTDIKKLLENIDVRSTVKKFKKHYNVNDTIKNETIKKKDEEISQLILEKTNLNAEKVAMERMLQQYNQVNRHVGGTNENIENDEDDYEYEMLNISNVFEKIKTIVSPESEAKINEEEKQKVEQIIKNVKERIDKILSTTREYENVLIEKIALVKKTILANDGLHDFIDDFNNIEKLSIQTMEKIYDYYNNQYSKMDLIINKHFGFVYIFKALRIALFYVSLMLATKIFEEMYMKVVYTENKDPPSLFTFVFIFLAFDFGFCLFIYVILLLIKYIFYTPNSTFIIDTQLLIKILIDYIISTLLIFILSLIICNIIQKKKYFRYKLEGPRAIRACHELLFGCSIVIFLIPYFLIL